MLPISGPRWKALDMLGGSDTNTGFSPRTNLGVRAPGILTIEKPEVIMAC